MFTMLLGKLEQKGLIQANTTIFLNMGIITASAAINYFSNIPANLIAIVDGLHFLKKQKQMQLIESEIPVMA